MAGIAKTLMELAEDEGKQSAIDTAQQFQSNLESLAEAGNAMERTAACMLLREVNAALTELTNA